MANQKEKKTQEIREAGAEQERKGHRLPPSPKEAHEGMPGYGQPDEEVRRERLPEQEW
ncbi:MAG TPA: hypothetical protein VLQ93_25530 [Myxococcaceae bacterium]|nr:hypothetical protein [Myxococcaceae bacterium]